MKSILVVGHGSRSKDALEVFNKVLDNFKLKVEDNVEGCFMELCAPNIPDTIDIMYKNGARNIVVVPYFLFCGIHIKDDIPGILKEVKAKYVDLKISLARPIGYNKIIADILKENSEGELTCI
ncbi:CbiX/SirB N-terminal domain-containing protein [Clostridium tagluense]|uniref:sirohydrochlorin chelatase n=1 Tax=Clostridium TaxID=1485 RepID=UPI0013E94162|nr:MULTISPECIES: CbiX/SirB N-terminal domain-containing protein [Clostridium]MBU3129721.1 CbiX/SirB N-terminal domain-containing protein [Clostridium tagluense]MBW9157326.1 CbiX/SirB N-terminal domain-containing protein [Clostridium tagluense]MBZ9623466.1 CbiX/SirB N-terminal domain-containing protein [Clostridium sp. FP2]MBZ9634888.1 CbiX/SirB N-terminal domain-containing protein [Clostridium sp. FP1]MCB2310868.1 CbiX/SirB N-terminal domain-containing protein [Clostridium tagluense]